MVQGVGPKFKPQYHKRKKREKKGKKNQQKSPYTMSRYN
jgi:hypothetical protein